MNLASRLSLLAATALAISCATVPGTGRKQLRLIPTGQMMSLSAQSYDDFLTEHPPVVGTPEAQMVERVGQRIAGVVEQYLRDTGRAKDISRYSWSFKLVQSDEVNAWCMPGGRVVFYTGILPLTRDEDGLAVVMGHEIAHAVAEHGNERMSQHMVANFGGMALSQLLQERPETTRNLWMAAYGAGAQYGALLPFSRKQESEADELGLLFSSKAGYDPRAAVGFWQRMAQAKGGGAPPEMLSTHPSDKTRIAAIQKLLPEAMKHYEAAKR